MTALDNQIGCWRRHARSVQVRLIVPFPPGGPSDVMGRVYADKLGTLWNQPVIVENRAGAAGNIGSELTAIMHAELEKWTKVIQSSNIKAD